MEGGGAIVHSSVFLSAADPPRSPSPFFSVALSGARARAGSTLLLWHRTGHRPPPDVRRLTSQLLSEANLSTMVPMESTISLTVSAGMSVLFTRGTPISCVRPVGAARRCVVVVLVVARWWAEVVVRSEDCCPGAEQNSRLCRYLFELPLIKRRRHNTTGVALRWSSFDEG